jgi:hypothetical protein
MENRKSEINKTFVIKEEEWVISLARIANTLITQHAFIILEAIEEGEPTIYFMDFVGRSWPSSLPNSEIGVVRYEKCDKSSEQADKGLIFCSSKKMMQLESGDKIASKQWYISKDDALELIKKIKAEKKEIEELRAPLPFCILGQDSLLTQSSASSSSKEKGHSCFSWAKEKLHGIGDPSIKVEGSNSVEFVNKFAAITGLTVTTITRLTASSSTQNSFDSFWAQNREHGAREKELEERDIQNEQEDKEKSDTVDKKI